MPFVIVTSESRRCSHVIEGLTVQEADKLHSLLKGWGHPQDLAPQKIEYKSAHPGRATTDILNALEVMGYTLVALQTRYHTPRPSLPAMKTTFTDGTDEDLSKSYRAAVWTLHRIAGTRKSVIFLIIVFLLLIVLASVTWALISIGLIPMPSLLQRKKQGH